MDGVQMNWSELIELFNSFSFERTITLILGVAGVIAILDYVGLLPPGAAKWLARNRLDSTLTALKRLGVRFTIDDSRSKKTIFQSISEAVGISEPLYLTNLRSMLAEDTFDAKVKIGGTTNFQSEAFIDVMGASTSSERCAEYARILKTYFDASDFDIIATPKTGSPILGYEYSRLVLKPFILGAHEKVRALDDVVGLHNFLDFPKQLPLTGRRVLIVDDSTTGGRKIVELVAKLREAGCEVTRALVLFEPQGKGAREKLSNIGIALDALTAGPKGRV